MLIIILLTFALRAFQIRFVLLVLLHIRLLAQLLLMTTQQPLLVLVETDEIEVQVLYPVIIQNVLRPDELAEVQIV